MWGKSVERCFLNIWALDCWMAPLTSTEDTNHKQTNVHSQYVFYIEKKTSQVQDDDIPVHFWNTLIGFLIE